MDEKIKSIDEALNNCNEKLKNANDEEEIKKLINIRNNLIKSMIEHLNNSKFKDSTIQIKEINYF
jgi:hypothetical protein